MKLDAEIAFVFRLYGLSQPVPGPFRTMGTSVASFDCYFARN